MIENEKTVPVREKNSDSLETKYRWRDIFKRYPWLFFLILFFNGCEDEPFYKKCTEQICLECSDCGPEDVPVLDESLRLQNIAYTCLSELINYDPSDELGYPAILYLFLHDTKNFHGSNYGITPRNVIISKGFIGEVHGTNAVTRVEDVRLELHETAHAYTYVALGVVPPWYNEGFSIFIESVLQCDPKQFGTYRLANAIRDWDNLKNGLPIAWGNSLDSPHSKGAIFFAALITDYGWDGSKLVQLFNNLRKIHKTGREIDTRTIRAVAEEINDGDLSYLFEILEIE